MRGYSIWPFRPTASVWSQARFHRSEGPRAAGAAPELRDVTFEVMPDNSTEWTLLGTARRVPGGWEMTGLTLPVSGSIRASGFSGTSIIEAGSSFVRDLTGWRLHFFDTAENAGAAADDADPDQDGLTNFTEFAFGLSPVDHESNTLPEFKYAGGFFTSTFTASEGREDVIYGAEWSPD